MFEKDIETKFKQIFDVKKVSFGEQGESNEQECVFVEIEKSVNNIRDGKAIARVEGTARIFGDHTKMPFGYFSKAIKRANSDLTKGFFFHNFESNKKLYGDIVERSIQFVYFFEQEFDPNKFNVTTANVDVEEQE